MDVVRTCCKLSRIHHDFTALSLRPHYALPTSLAFSPRPCRAFSTFIQSPGRLHCVVITSLQFLTRSCPVRSRFLLRPPRLMKSFNHFQIKTFFANRSLLPLSFAFHFRPLLILVLNHSANSCCYTDGTIPLLSKPKIQASFYLSSVAVESGLCQICPETPKTGFLMTGFINILPLVITVYVLSIGVTTSFIIH